MGNIWSWWNGEKNSEQPSEESIIEKRVKQAKRSQSKSGLWYIHPNVLIKVPKPCETCDDRITELYTTHWERINQSRDLFRRNRADYKNNPECLEIQSQEEYNDHLDKQFVWYHYLAKRNLNKKKIEITYMCPNRGNKKDSLFNCARRCTRDSEEDT
jgi:hypothetical protein